jgi:hypothetical protein
MLASVLRLSGLDRRLAAFKLRLDEKASEAADHIKAVVVRMFVVAALAVAAAVFALLALIAALVALYGWLEPTYGVFPALSIVGGVLALTALVLISAAMILSRGRPISEKGTPTPKTIEVPTSFARWNRASSWRRRRLSRARQRSFRPGIAPQCSPFLARRWRLAGFWSRQHIHQPSPTTEAVGGNWPLSTVID